MDKIRKELWVIRGKRLAVWGLAFKPNTDDIRFAPSLNLIKMLLEEGAEVRAYDPQAKERASALLPLITYCADPYEAACGVDAIIIATEWAEFLRVDWERLSSVVAHPLVLDGRNMLDPRMMQDHGFHYVSIGRPMAFASKPSLEVRAQNSSELTCALEGQSA